MSQNDSHEPVTVTDKRRIDPETGEVREQATGPAPSGPAPEAGGSPEEVTELKSTLQRVKAEYDNYRKRTLRDQQVIAERSKAAVLTELLPVLDDLERARSHGDLESGPFKAVADKLIGILEGLGLSGFGDEGEEFDPELHEAVQHEGDGTHPIVGNVMRRGYKVGDLVLRHAMVGVVDTVPDGADTADKDDESAEDPAES
ncbi:nucleotide exchange factor GrpE [Mycolicibacterium elephantis]|uniref:Protein GrpE n=2 Tax=Mycolicibacterium elephantis TaxID=81858 RepID=A0A439DS69_9MYCO|nr:nucleotide exchange factor GrpE [Mycolicibacterium elephantis]MCV7223794.1 nucleotide exchange factor GrpE [Mycolicibacterium elephantis]OBA89121.1 nucleotide exchange factor GrpE [Mycolicibacterium elephantis]OBB24867.1 nucleotide exchange factor GrpE [Mycolicibacterium elephantis]OBE98752.1 nucleotide exchange factor GrpE [Mycolicibacterium elephantis]ORA61851.1 nucleotide exchange factor GrpE [Mycolicibacterium elephantis]